MLSWNLIQNSIGTLSVELPTASSSKESNRKYHLIILHQNIPSGFYFRVLGKKAEYRNNHYQLRKEFVLAMQIILLVY